ncbi:AI-2E family transporter [Pandoraea pnomenusa]|uniref:AI-2E family transporter n=1 Tax=Pandoraea pnomenusa TaxID=93220 RepID=UPI0003C76922|nr:AI-2E family transporter [Pandoraea pnomenusa]AHB04421.1 membrane protein [Pandoraea pnomenusa 3kgm]AHN76438.1 AI-2E family transporter [Pandoraea pnomenusa]ANC44161.1 AI-2E family transporter [Pandoraea pnomenusa]QDH61365.1 AI-2E family transporter [Pandoraea pnomenusa]QDX23343.1 AI-2E family transporter [Pandoraea pnomenusa]
MSSRSDQRKFFHLMLFVVTVAFGWILFPLFGAVFWGTILALLFQPVQRRVLLRMRGRPNLAALTTLALVLLIVILPLTVVVGMLTQEVSSALVRFRTDLPQLTVAFQQLLDRLPASVHRIMDLAGVQDVNAIQQKLGDGAAQIGRLVAVYLVSIGQNTAQLLVSFGVMLYMLFFLLRDGVALGAMVRRALPLDERHKGQLIRQFTTVVRATVKGNIAVAVAQGMLGGFIFAVLGIEGYVLAAVVMAFLSLLPAVGAAVVWVPVGVWLLLSGAIWKGVVLFAFCGTIVSLVDNVLRPILVGKDTKLPDWVVLISTLGGMSLFGLTGFVIGPLIAALFIASWNIYTRLRDVEEDQADAG